MGIGRSVLGRGAQGYILCKKPPMSLMFYKHFVFFLNAEIGIFLVDSLLLQLNNMLCE